MQLPPLVTRILILLDGRTDGMKQCQIARALGEHPEAIARALAKADRCGVLLQEDDRGRIQRYFP